MFKNLHFNIIILWYHICYIIDILFNYNNLLKSIRTLNIKSWINQDFYEKGYLWVSNFNYIIINIYTVYLKYYIYINLILSIFISQILNKKVNFKKLFALRYMFNSDSGFPNIYFLKKK